MQPRTFNLEEPLRAEEVRVLGCLIEKEILTPDIYPLTLNALTNACNQKTSRDPVVDYDEGTVEATLEILRHRELAARITGSEHRVPKYRQLFTSVLNLGRRETAVLCVLLLRGPQTVGEINQRTNRLYEFSTIEEVEQTLERLAHAQPAALAMRLERHAGTKEPRYAHLLAGPVDSEPAPVPPPAARADRLAELAAEVEALKAEVARLRQEWLDFRRQFD
jgi:uncharacterized protein